MSIVAAVLKRWHGGVHPNEFKVLSEYCAIEPLPMPKRLYVPIHQHIGQPADPCVQAGDRVKKGEMIAQATGFVSAPVHAPTSGLVIGIEETTVGHPSGLTLPCVVIEPDGADQWSDTLAPIANPLATEPEQLRARIRECGIVGLGGATFPTFIKLSPVAGKKAELLLINGAECEPYLTCDARLMQERPGEMVEGIEIMMYLLGVTDCVIAIEDNKPDAIRVLSKVAATRKNIQVRALPVRYPQGAEKQLIEAVTHRQVPSGGLPIDVGVIVHNVGTAVAINAAVRRGQPLVSRIVTVSGKGILRPANLEVLIGTPVQALIKHCGGLKPGVKQVVMGGPMMGVALYNLATPVVKGTSGILAMTADETVDRPEQPCIRCGRCVEVCPLNLLPTELAFLARHDELDRLQDLHLFDCCECGSCAYVCPANVPLVQYFRYGKLTIQAKTQDKKRLDLDKARTAAKNQRVAREEAAKELKKAAMKAQMAARKPPPAPVAASETAPTADDA